MCWMHLECTVIQDKYGSCIFKFYLKCTLRQDKYGSCIFKLQYEKALERTYRDKKTTNKVALMFLDVKVPTKR